MVPTHFAGVPDYLMLKFSRHASLPLTLRFGWEHLESLLKSQEYWVLTYALSFYRSRNVLGWSKFFVPDQKFICILWQSQAFCARKKRCFAFSKIGFCAGTKVFEEALNAVKFLGWLKNIWTITKHFGTCKRTRHYFTYRYLGKTCFGM